MAYKKNIFVCFMLILNIMLYGCGKMENKFTIWGTIHANHIGENGEYFETDELYIENIDLIKKCPPEIKIIIAFYSKQFLHENNYTYSNRIDSILAGALGNYTSLQEAQNKLLENKEHYFKNVPQRDLRDYPGILEIEYGKNMAIVILSGIWGSHIGIDEYIINKRWEIEYKKF